MFVYATCPADGFKYPDKDSLILLLLVLLLLCWELFIYKYYIVRPVYCINFIKKKCLHLKSILHVY